MRQDMDLVGYLWFIRANLTAFPLQDTLDGPTHYSRKVHSLIIKDLHERDFGKYVCRAENNQGYADKTIILTGNKQRS